MSRPGLLIVLSVVGGLSLFSAAARAATIQVSTTADEYNYNGAGLGCSLREAVTAANKDVAFGGCSSGKGPDTILLPAGLYKLNRSGSDDTNVNGDLDVQGGVLDIVGGGAKKTTVDAQKLDRVLHALPSSELTLRGVTLRNGKSPSVGGALYVEGVAYLIDGTLADSEAAQYGGALAVAKSGRFGTDNCIMQSSHSAQGGGAIWNAGQIGLNGDTIRYDYTTSAGADGGGILNVGFMILNESSLYGNVAEGQGGAVANKGDASTIGVLMNVTVSDNAAKGNAGGVLNAAAGKIGLYNVTLADNRADSNSDGTGQGGGIFVESGDVVLANTILGNNMEKTNAAASANDCRGSVVSLGYNLIETIGGCTLVGTFNDKLGQDPGLDALGDNGGPTLTRRLKPNSPALDAGDPKGCFNLNDTEIVTDARSSTRPADYYATGTPRCDIGAFEALPYGLCFAKPEKAKPLAPANQSPTDEDHAGLDWDDVPCTTRYKVIVREGSPNGPSFAHGQTHDVSTFRFAKPLTVGKSYFWRVKACNVAGCSKSPWSSFKVTAPL